MNAWLSGARPRTLGVAVAPVLVGTAVAWSEVGDAVIWWRAAAAFVVAVAIQVGTNYANDYSDGVRGTDSNRQGPQRLTASGVVSPTAVKRAAIVSFAAAAAIGLALAIAVDLRLLLVGAAAIGAGVLYTGGPRPYGYEGFGELSVLAFFGLVATCGSTYVQLEQVPGVAAVAGVALGLLAAAILVTNNLRDLRTDDESGKRTLAVRFGVGATRGLYLACVAGAFVTTAGIGVARPMALLAFVALPFALSPARAVLTCEDAPALVGALVGTARLQLVFGALLAGALALS